ncbi:MAG: DUF3800 domain-containing protein [Parvularcula sp.]|nr:DUF3800 domain-containing protein [Parvularcula sp.]
MLWRAMASDEPHDAREGVLDLFLDESGFTGSRLLDPNQPVFAYASVAIGERRAWDILNRARKDHPVQMPELKAQKLLSSERGRRLVAQVLTEIDGLYSFVIQNKRVVLCGKLFEYVFEPVFQFSPELLYQKNFHRFVAMYCFINSVDGVGEVTLLQFESYMRSLDPSDAPLLFDPNASSHLPENHPLKLVLRFANGYRDIIVADNARLRTTTPDEGKYVLDVSAAGLWSLLNHWGRQKRPLRVVCDDSKPIAALLPSLIEEGKEFAIQRAVALGGSPDQFGWDLAEPVAMTDSRGSPGLQIADLVASSATRVAKDRDETSEIAIALDRHIHPHSIGTDLAPVQLDTREADVNWLVLMELAERADRRDDPRLGLEAVYHFAEQSWAPDRLGG